MAAMWSRNDNSVIVLPVLDLISIFTVDLDDKLCLDFFFPVRPGFYLPFFNGRGLYLPFSNDGKRSVAEGLPSPHL